MDCRGRGSTYRQQVFSTSFVKYAHRHGSTAHGVPWGCPHAPLPTSTYLHTYFRPKSKLFSSSSSSSISTSFIPACRYLPIVLWKSVDGTNFARGIYIVEKVKKKRNQSTGMRRATSSSIFRKEFFLRIVELV